MTTWDSFVSRKSVPRFSRSETIPWRDVFTIFVSRLNLWAAFTISTLDDGRSIAFPSTERIRPPSKKRVPTRMSQDTVEIRVEFGGGTELLLAPPHEKKHTLTIPRTDTAGNETNVSFLIGHIRKNLITEREELFVDGDSV